jgi:hypothetical protein
MSRYITFSTCPAGGRPGTASLFANLRGTLRNPQRQHKGRRFNVLRFAEGLPEASYGHILPASPNGLAQHPGSGPARILNV